MARVNAGLTTFNAGEWSAILHGRIDLGKYSNACRRMLNMIPLAQGMAIRRPGTIFANATKSNGVARIVGFVAREDAEEREGFILELGDGYMRVIRDRAQVTVTGEAQSVTNGDFPSNITGWTDGSSGGAAAIAWNSANAALELQSDTGSARAQQTISRTNGASVIVRFQIKKIWTALSGVSRVVMTDTGSTTFQFLAYEEGWYAIQYTAGGASGTLEFACGGGAGSNPLVDNISYHPVSGAAFEITTPWAAADIDDLVMLASNDVLFVLHGDYPPYKISHYDDASWSVSKFNFRDGPYLDQNTTGTTLTPGATSGNAVTLTASSVTGINGGRGFLSTDIGRLVRILNGSPAKWGWGRIVAYTSTTVVTIEVLKAFQATTGVAAWRLGAWSDTTGWPRAGVFHDGRLWFGGTTTQPQTLWGSRSNDFDKFDPTEEDGTVVDDNGITLTLADNRVNSILWMESDTRGLVVGTAGGVFGVAASTLGETLTPDNARARRYSSKGVAPVAPVRHDGSVLYLPKSRQALSELAYSFERDAEVSNEMSLFAQHLLRGQLKALAWQPEPWGVVWAIDDDGALRGMTYLREQDVVGWHQHEIGCEGDDVRNVKVLSIASKPGTVGDELWVLVEREFRTAIGWATRRYIERLGDWQWPKDPTAKADLLYLDSALVYDGASATTIAAAHLSAGISTSDVEALGGGAVLPGAQLLGNYIFDNAVTEAVIGLPFISDLAPLDLEAGSPNGVAKGSRQRVDNVAIYFWQTLGAVLMVDEDGDKSEEIEFRHAGDPMDSSPPLFTGIKICDMPAGWAEKSRLMLRQTLPLPMNVGFISPRVSTNDRTGTS
jgi:hypothetical protein